MDSLTNKLYRLTMQAFAIGWSGAPKYEAHLTAEGFLVLSGEPYADANSVMIVGGAAEERLAEFGARLARLELPCIGFFAPDVVDRISPVARDFGFAPVGKVPLMVLESTHRPSPGKYPAALVATDAQINDALTIVARALVNWPDEVAVRVFRGSYIDAAGVAMFVVRDGADAISTVTTLRQGATVGIFSMATLAEHQRQGAGYACLAHAVSHHQATGAHRFYLYATEAGLPLYRRLGFQTIVEVPVWVRGHSSQVPG
jgi:GNAT superfamily N-acetyltransferase